jgi:hypothetical protein
MYPEKCCNRTLTFLRVDDMVIGERLRTQTDFKGTDVYLLLGSLEDLCCFGVQAALEARGYPTRIVSNPFAHPSRFVWRLTNEESNSQLVLDQEPPLSDENITGVLVRRSGWIDPDGWQTEDLAYMQMETQAALLAWLWSLPCPVVNRYSAGLWYETHLHPLSWNRLLRRCGLTTPETLITNIEDESRVFGRHLAEGGVVYGPLSREVRYLITDNKDWNGLAAMQRCTPVCLTYPHEAAQFVCVVGQETVWEGEPPREAAQLEPALHSFADAAGLAFVQLALARTSRGICVIRVEPHPYLENFSDRAQQQIVDELVNLLTADSGVSRESAELSFQRSCV